MRRLAPLLAIVPAMLLMGCFAMEMDIVVNEDGSGTQTVRITLPAEVMGIAGGELMGVAGEVPSAEELQASFESDPEMAALRDALEDAGGSMEFFSTDDGLGFAMTLNVPASDDFAAAVQDVAASLPDSESLPLGSVEGGFTLKKTGDRWEFVNSSPPLSSEDLAAMSGDPSMAGMMDMMMGQITLVTRLRLPGEVTEHNADEVLADGTLVWNLTGGDLDRTLSATSDVSTGLGTPVIAGIAIGVLLLAGLGGLVLLRKRSGAEPPAV